MERRRTRAAARRRHERGIAIAMTGLLIIPMMIFAAFGVDLASWYARISEIQRAADAAALAGAVWMPNESAATEASRASLQSHGLVNAAGVGIGGITWEPRIGDAGTSSWRITVTDNDADRHFSSIFMDGPAVISRYAEAEYHLPIPLGSPLNYFGGDATQTALPSYDVYSVSWPSYYQTRVPTSNVSCNVASTSAAGAGRWSGNPLSYSSSGFDSGDTDICAWGAGRTTASGSSTTPPPDYSSRAPSNPTCRVRSSGATHGYWNSGSPPTFSGSGSTTTNCSWPNSNTDMSFLAGHPGGNNASGVPNTNPTNRPCRVGYQTANGWYASATSNWTNSGTMPANMTGGTAGQGNRLCQWSAVISSTTVTPPNPIDSNRSPGFWAAISGPGGVAAQGQAFSARCTETVNNCSNANRNRMFRTTGYWYVIEVPESSPAGFTVRIFDANQRTGGDSPAGDSRDGSGSSAYYHTTYRVWEQENPLNGTNNPTSIPGTPTNGNQQYTGGGSCHWDLTGGSGGDDFTAQWRDLCTIASPSGGDRYLLNVNVHDANHSVTNQNTAVGAGLNGYAIEAVSSSCDENTGACQPAVYAYTDMAMYNNLEAGDATFYLAEVEDHFAGKTLVLDLWDAGDADGVARMTPMMPSSGSIGPTVEVPSSQCSYSSETDNPIHTSPTYGGATGTRVGDTTPSGTTCTILTSNQTNLSGTPRATIYNDVWLRIRIQIPLNYSCDENANPVTQVNSCWWGIRYNFSHSTTDATTWAARVEGNPLQLTE